MGHVAVQTGGPKVGGHMIVIAGQTDNYCNQSGYVRARWEGAARCSSLDAAWQGGTRL